MELQAIVEKIAVDFSLEPDVEIAADTELLMSGILDSFSVVGLVAWLEEEIAASIPPGLITFESFENPTSIHSLCRGVAESAPQIDEAVPLSVS